MNSKIASYPSELLKEGQTAEPHDSQPKGINARLVSVFFQGFASGLPIALCGTALQAWFTLSQINLLAIGTLGLVGQPYVYKFIWAPLLDRFQLPWLDRRRGWIVVMQVLLVLTLLLMSFGNPATSPWLLAALGFSLAAFSATQDIAIDAYRTDLLKPEERGLGAGYATAGYRIAMLVSGGLAMIAADYIGWALVYRWMAVLMLIGIFASCLGSKVEVKAKPPRTLHEAVVAPIEDFVSRYPFILLIICIIFYKLGDAMAMSMTTSFLLRGLAFSQSQVGMVLKIFGMSATILGVFLGGALMTRLGLYRALWYFGILQALTNLLFALLALIGHNFSLMSFVVFVEQLCSGMGTAAFLALLMGLCNPAYTATQYALLSAAAAVGRVFIGPFAGFIAQQYGWVDMYLWSFLIALPGLGALVCMRRYHDFGVSTMYSEANKL